MANKDSSFDVTTGVDLQEVDNAINQTQKEVAQRYDFKGSKAEVYFKRAESKILLVADSDFQMTVGNGRMNRRSIDARIGNGGRRLDLNTVSGDVKLRMGSR